MVLPKLNRLKKRQDFATVYRQGIRRNSSHLILRAYQRCSPTMSGAQPSRIGFSISQKVSNRAVVRNRIKRQLRAGFRQLLPHLLPGWDVVIVVRSQAINCDYHQFLQELKQLLAEAEILNGH